MAVCRLWCKLQPRLLVCTELEYLNLPSHGFKTLTRFIAFEQPFLNRRHSFAWANKIPMFVKPKISQSHWHESATGTYTEATQSTALPRYLLTLDPFHITLLPLIYTLTSKVIFSCTFSAYSFVPSSI
jgi:hypothetical protein